MRNVLKSLAVPLVSALVSLALPVMAQDCELYISVQQRCFPGIVLSGAFISATNRAGQVVFTDITNMQGCRRIVLSGNDEYTIKITTGIYAPEIQKIKDLCLKVEPQLMFFLFPAGVVECPAMMIPIRQPGDLYGEYGDTVYSAHSEE
ncbi:MAG: hypothetical protein WCP20_15410 [Desulfuromonadales bacterium]